MRFRIILLTAILLVLVGSALADQPDVKQITRPENIPSFLGYAPGELIVQFKMPVEQVNATKSLAGYLSLNMFSLDAIAEKYEVTGMRQVFPGAKPTVKNGQAMDLSRYHKIRFDPAADLDEVMNAYLSDPNVESVEKNGMHSMYATPNDGYYDPHQWYHNQVSDHDIDSPEAWDLETGDENLIIALLDSGTRYFHPDLGGVNASISNPGASRGNMWINNAELNGSSGVDDDGNGYVDDWIGWDFIDGVSNCWTGEDCTTEDNDPRDFNGHGTHTAGIMAMLTNDGYGMAGTAGGWGNGSQAVTGNGVKVMVLRNGYSYNYLGQEYGVVMMDASAAAFYYAADNGAQIASCSWGSSNSGGIGAAVDYFLASGGMVFVAAGNGSAEESPDYLNGRGDCISVGATNESDDGASFTTYGTWVDISAPGDNIYSTFHDHTDPNTNYWASMGGTSMATPMTAAVGGLIWSKNPGWTASQVETQLYASADNIDAYLSSKYIGKMGVGRINSYNAVNTGTPPPVAAFVGSPTSGCAPLSVNFTDQSTGDITSWSWNFGDTQTSTAQSPSHSYTSAGTYTVTLTVTGPGGSDDEIKTNYITVNGAPTAGFIGSPTSGTEPLTVNFTDQSTDATGWSWDFGDGVGTSTLQNPNYTYDNAGTYTVTLTATNACGSDQLVRTDYITVNPCVLPTADFTGTPTSGEVPLLVNFTDASTGATSWLWDFGDGVGTSTQQNPGYTYNAAGTYTVTLTATNACGSDQLVRTDYITVTCTPPVAGFSGTPTSGEVPLLVNFTDASTGATSWLWDFGDGVGTSTQQNPGYTYNAAGTYTVTLTATNSCGADDEIKADYITVTCTAPVADFSGTPTSGSAPLTVDFTDLSSNATGWSWDFGDGVGTSTLQNPSYTYTAEGTYTVALTASNSCGSDVATKLDYISVTVPSETKAYAQSEVTALGTTTGSYVNTYASDNSYEAIVEAVSTNHPVKVTSNADHTWTFNLGSGGSNTMFYLEAYRPANSDGDDFVFEYSTDGSTFLPLVTVASATEQVYSVGMPALTGTVYVKVTDNNRSWGLISLDAVYVDEIYFSFESGPTPPVAAFVGTPTSGQPPLSVAFTDLSTGSPTSWDWDFGDGVGTSTAQNPGYVYNAVGSYTVTLTVTNAYGSDAEVKTGYINVTEAGNNMFVFDMAVGRAKSGPNYYGTCTVTIHDDNTNPVSGATVYVTATGPTGGSYNGVTVADGSVDFQTSGMKKPVGEWCFEVTNVTHATLTYDPGSNNVTQECESGPVYKNGGGDLMAAIPADFKISNHPNPFNPSTILAFALPSDSYVRLDIYNILGQKVETLVDEHLSAGNYSYDWDGSKVASGIYLYRLTTDQFSATKKMVLMK